MLVWMDGGFMITVQDLDNKNFGMFQRIKKKKNHRNFGIRMSSFYVR